jgi:Uri superfamily endonuclease
MYTYDIGKYVYSARNAGKGSAKPRLSPVSKPHTHITYMLRQCTSIVYICNTKTSLHTATIKGNKRL